MATMAHHLLAKTTTDEILNNFKTGSWTYGASGHGTNFLRTGTPADFPSPDAAFYDSVNKELSKIKNLEQILPDASSYEDGIIICNPNINPDNN